MEPLRHKKPTTISNEINSGKENNLNLSLTNHKMNQNTCDSKHNSVENTKSSVFLNSIRMSKPPPLIQIGKVSATTERSISIKEEYFEDNKQSSGIITKNNNNNTNTNSTSTKSSNDNSPTEMHDRRRDSGLGHQALVHRISGSSTTTTPNNQNPHHNNLSRRESLYSLPSRESNSREDPLLSDRNSSDKSSHLESSSIPIASKIIKSTNINSNSNQISNNNITDNNNVTNSSNSNSNDILKSLSIKQEISSPQNEVKSTPFSILAKAAKEISIKEKLEGSSVMNQNLQNILKSTMANNNNHTSSDSNSNNIKNDTSSSLKKDTTTSTTIQQQTIQKVQRDCSKNYELTVHETTDGTIYEIACGGNLGQLYQKKFICPGINAKCIKLMGTVKNNQPLQNSENSEWCTPKEFVARGGKESLKDWKRAIKIQKTNLRKLIESGSLDYYQHKKMCSNQCRSNKGDYLTINGSASSVAKASSFDTSYLSRSSVGNGFVGETSFGVGSGGVADRIKGVVGLWVEAIFYLKNLRIFKNPPLNPPFSETKTTQPSPQSTKTQTPAASTSK